MIDLLEDENGALLWVDGDVRLGESTAQHIRDILLAVPGEYEQAPGATVGLKLYLEDERYEEMKAEIRRKIARDGMVIKTLNYTNPGLINIDAYYPNS